MRKNNSTESEILLRQKLGLILLGIVLFFLILEAGLRLGGGIITSLQEYRNRISLKRKGTYRIMCVGESTTSDCDAWPDHLGKILNRSNIGIKFSVINKGVGGVNTSYLVNKVEENLNKHKPNMVITMMGINDFSAHVPHENMISVSSRSRKFFRHFRIYKLARLLWLHMVTKAQETGFFKPKTDNEVCNLNSNLVVNNIKEEHAQTNFVSSEESLRKVIELNPASDEAYVNLAEFYKKEGKFDQAEECYKKAMELNQSNNLAYVGLICCYRTLDKPNQGEETFKKAIEQNPHNELAYVYLGWCYTQQKKYVLAEGVFTKALELNPNNDTIYLELARCYREQGKLTEAEKTYKRGIELNPNNDANIMDLAWMYRDLMGNYDLAEGLFRKAIEVNPRNYLAYIQLGRRYREQRKFTQAEEMFRKAVKLNPDPLSYGVIAGLYVEIGKNELAEQFYQKANKSTQEYMNPITSSNYKRLKKILENREIQLVYVQYPTKRVQLLKEIFEQGEKIVFVDNERVFKEAIKKDGYWEYFKDIFGGTFGHLTVKGNRLLAENIANVILKEAFHKQITVESLNRD